MIKITKKDLNLPNFLTLLRIVLIIPFLCFFFAERWIGMLAVLMASALSDLFDGFLARHLNQVTEVGTLLDPIADKLTQVTISFCLAYRVHILIPMFILFLLKDGFMVAGGAVLLKKKIRPVAAKWYGKTTTVIFYLTVLSVAAGTIFWPDSRAMRIVTLCLAGLTCIFMVFTFIQYARIYAQVTKAAKHGKNPKAVLPEDRTA